MGRFRDFNEYLFSEFGYGKEQADRISEDWPFQFSFLKTFQVEDTAYEVYEFKNGDDEYYIVSGTCFCLYEKSGFLQSLHNFRRAMGDHLESKPSLHCLKSPEQCFDLHWNAPYKQESSNQGPRLLKKEWRDLGAIRSYEGKSVCRINSFIFSTYALSEKIYGKVEFHCNTRFLDSEYCTIRALDDLNHGWPSYGLEIVSEDQKSNVKLIYSKCALSGKKQVDLGLHEISQPSALQSTDFLKFTVSKAAWRGQTSQVAS
jgi:hypothetical protein